MMVQYSLLIDLDLCVGCHACEVSCKQEHNTPVGSSWIHVIRIGPKKVNERLTVNFVPIRCMHCSKPHCIDACPVKAITKRSDGIVLIDKNVCMGCKLCIEACPIGAPQFNPEEGIVEVCTLCVDRVDKGLRPICEKHCPAGAIHFGDINEITKIKRERIQERLL